MKGCCAIIALKGEMNMYVKQISVFIENTPGRLADFTHLLGEHQIDLISLSIADTTTFGILRGIVKDYEKAVEIINQAGYTACLTDVLTIAVPDEPGSLAKVLQLLSEHGISIEYLYSFLRDGGKQAYIILRTEQIDKAYETLCKNGVRLLSQEEVCSL